MKSQRLNAEGEEFAADHGSIVVLRPTGPGPAQEFVRTRGEGVMGATILAGDVDAARSLVQKNTDRKLPSYDGWYGKSFLIPSEIASGAWIEIAQGPAARADAE